MPADPPAVLIPLMTQPIVTKNLSIKVMSFKRTMVDMSFWSLKEEKTVMINGNVPPVQTSESRDIVSIAIVYNLAPKISICRIVFDISQPMVTYITAYDVEPRCVEGIGLCKVGHTTPKMAKLMDRCRAYYLGINISIEMRGGKCDQRFSNRCLCPSGRFFSAGCESVVSQVLCLSYLTKEPHTKLNCSCGRTVSFSAGVCP